MYTTILWATDGSPEANAALASALELLEPDGTLVAFHCDQRFVGSHVGGISVYPDELERIQHIRGQIDDLVHRGIRVRPLIERTIHDPAHEIARAADDLGVEAIVCGTRSMLGLPAVLSGSVAARLLKHATVPVIVVPAHVADREPATV